MDTPDNYYAILGVPIDADSNTLKRAYRQLARRYHPDLAGAGGAVQMKRINRAYDVLSDPEKRRSYDTIVGGVIDFRKGGAAHVRPKRPEPHTFDPNEDIDFPGFNIFSTKGPLRRGTAIHSQLGVVTALSSVHTVHGILIAAGSLDGKGMLWQVHRGQIETPIAFSANPAFTIESLRELRLSSAGALLAGWGQLGLHVWDALNGNLLWSYQLQQRAVSAHYSLDVMLQIAQKGQRSVNMALPLLPEDTRAPRSRGVRGTDVVSHLLDMPDTGLSEPIVCAEQGIENRQFWAIRLRTLAQDAQTLLTLSCGNVPNERQEMAVIRRWDLTTRSRTGRVKPQIAASVLVGSCADCAPPYAVTPDTKTVAFVHTGKKIRLCDTLAGTYNELLSGTMGGSAKLALSPDTQWVAIAREDSEVNEGVIDLWSTGTGQVIQKLYHPWQVSALHFANKQLVVALTDGTIQIWE